jgi:hypothetical protein
MSNPKYNVYVTILTVFADNRFNQTDPNYYKILLDNSLPIKKQVTALHKTIDDCLQEIFKEYLKVDKDWTMLKLVDVRKENLNIELVYTCRAIFMEECNKAGEFVDINTYLNTVKDKYYAEKISIA